MGAGAAAGLPNTDGATGADGGGVGGAAGLGANTTGAGAAGGGSGAGGRGGMGALARCCAKTRVGGGAATGWRVAARRAAMVGSLSRSNRASIP